MVLLLILFVHGAAADSVAGLDRHSQPFDPIFRDPSRRHVRALQQSIHANPQSRFDGMLPHVARISDRPANQSNSNKAVRFPAALVETGMETLRLNAATELAPG